MTAKLTDLVEATRPVIELHADMWDDLGEHLTCGEYEAFAGMLAAFEATEALEWLTDAHSRSDDFGDGHHDHRGECDYAPDSQCTKENFSPKEVRPTP